MNMSDNIVGHPVQKLLFFVAQDISESMASQTRQFVSGLEMLRKWVIKPPYVVDVNDGTRDNTSVGGVLEIYSASPSVKLPKDIDALHFEEVNAVVEAVKKFSRANNLEFEFELDGKFVGAIDEGELDRSLRDGLLGEWQKQLAS